MTGTVLASVEDLLLQTQINNERLVVTSGGFDPMHVGHLRCLIESARIALQSGPRTRLAVVVNGDGFLMRKKGFAFMPAAERMEIIAGVAGVNYVVPWDDGTQTVTGALEILKPFAFTKGGDRDDESNVPEFELCRSVGCNVIFGVGGGKIQSSSQLVNTLRSRE